MLRQDGFRDVRSTKGGELKVTRVIVGQAPAMTEPRTAPYGTWPSPITADAARRRLGRAERARMEDGVAYWLEGRPARRVASVVVRSDPGRRAVDVTPAGFNVRTLVHEYGGGVVHGARGTVVLLEPRGPAALSAGARRRTDPDHARDRRPASLRRRPRHARRLTAGSVRPRTPRGRRDVVNELVVIAADGSAMSRSIAGTGLLLVPADLARRHDGSPGSRGTSRGCRGTARELWSATSRRRRRSRAARRSPARTARSRSVQPEWSPDGRAALRLAIAPAGGTSYAGRRRHGDDR